MLILEWHSWLYTLYLAMDANFRLKCRDRGIKNDPELSPGAAYFVDNKRYLQIMETFGDQVEVCSMFRQSRLMLILPIRSTRATQAFMPSITLILVSPKIMYRTELGILSAPAIPSFAQRAPLISRRARSRHLLYCCIRYTSNC